MMKKHKKQISEGEKDRKEASNLQRQLDTSPSGGNIQALKDLRLVANRLVTLEESQAKQKSQTLWLKEGDGNTKYFFNSMNQRYNGNRITVIHNDDGTIISNSGRVKRVVDYYHKIFGSECLSTYPGLEKGAGVPPSGAPSSPNPSLATKYMTLFLIWGKSARSGWVQRVLLQGYMAYY